MQQKFYELLHESTLVQAIMTLILICTLCYMYVSGQDVPDGLIGIVSVIVGYYFGNKVNIQTKSLMKAQTELLASLKGGNQ